MINNATRLKKACTATIWFATLLTSYSEVLEYISFEQEQGYEQGSPWVGQEGWSGSSELDGDALLDLAAGFVSDLPGSGQQAYLGGRVAPVDNSANRVVKHETFRHFALNVSDKIVRWSMKVYIHIEDPLSQDLFSIILNEFSLPFTLFSLTVDNSTGQLIAGSRTTPTETGVFLQFDTVHLISFQIDYEQSRWSAFLDDSPIIEDQPLISIFGTEITTFGTIIFLWQDSQNAPERGDRNYMLIDDLVIATIEELVEPTLTIGHFGNPQLSLRVTGSEGQEINIQQSSDLQEWSPFLTFQIPASREVTVPIALSERGFFRFGTP